MVGEDLPTTLTLKNIPDAVYKALKASAINNRRSLNSEAIACLERTLVPVRVTVEERLERARLLRARMLSEISPEEIDAYKREGRP
jgi:plasmid stability protein